MKDLIDQRSKSPPSPLKLVVDQILKGHEIALHNTALLVKRTPIYAQRMKRNVESALDKLGRLHTKGIYQSKRAYS
jgi:hypothetical protein